MHMTNLLLSAPTDALEEDGAALAHTAQHQLARGDGAADVDQPVHLRGVVGGACRTLGLALLAGAVGQPAGKDDGRGNLGRVEHHGGPDGASTRPEQCGPEHLDAGNDERGHQPTLQAATTSGAASVDKPGRPGPDGAGAVAQRQQLHVFMPQQQHIAHRHQGRADRIAQQPADGRLQAAALVGQPLRLQGRGVAAHRLHHIAPGHGLNGIGDEGAAVIAAPFERHGGAAAQQGIKALGPVAQARRVRWLIF
jgi:hypothetical protein